MYAVRLDNAQPRIAVRYSEHGVEDPLQRRARLRPLRARVLVLVEEEGRPVLRREPRVAPRSVARLRGRRGHGCCGLGGPASGGQRRGYLGGPLAHAQLARAAGVGVGLAEALAHGLGAEVVAGCAHSTRHIRVPGRSHVAPEAASALAWARLPAWGERARVASRRHPRGAALHLEKVQPAPCLCALRMTRGLCLRLCSDAAARALVVMKMSAAMVARAGCILESKLCR